MKIKKRIILIDLDGVLNEYIGNFDEKFISPIKHGAKEFLSVLAEKHTIKIFTTRNRLIASKWVIENGLDGVVEDVTNVKEPCWVYVDDRCINFDGNFDDLIEKIEKFIPYYK